MIVDSSQKTVMSTKSGPISHFSNVRPPQRVSCDSAAASGTMAVVGVPADDRDAFGVHSALYIAY